MSEQEGCRPMNQMKNSTSVDLGIVILTNLINLLLALLFWSRVARQSRIAQAAGIGTIILGIPLAFLVFANIILHREWWRVVLPLSLVLFLLVEWVLDYVLKLEFRLTWMVGPYLLLYYLASMVMVGYAFLVKTPYGVVTLISYFLQVGLGVYSRIKTGL